MKWFKSLKLQIATALLLIMLLFIGVFSLSQIALKKQRTYNTLFSITAQLQHTANSMISQGMVYSMGVPEGSEHYQRDVEIYRKHLMKQLNLFHMLTMGFMHAHFEPSLTQLNTIFEPKLTPQVQDAVNHVENIWLEFQEAVLNAMGDNTNLANIHVAARHIVHSNQPLLESLTDLDRKVQNQAALELKLTQQVYWGALFFALCITMGIFAWFYRTVLQPLAASVEGFTRVTQGDFGYQLPLQSDNEIASMTRSFNRLSSRLNAIFKLIDQIQQGSDLDETLSFVAQEFPRLLPLDWVGALFVAGDDVTIILERSYRDGKPSTSPRTRFRFGATLLQQAIQSGEPLHIPNMLETAQGNPDFKFLNHLANEGLRDAIFLPITELSPIPGVLAFATEKAESYTPEHLELLTNIANLVTHSFGRTVKMAESTRLAAIGEFASGIAHEIRSPLSTITMALDYFENADLPGSTHKRAELAHREAQRMARLLEEILLYAKPLQLERSPLDINQFIVKLLKEYKSLASEKSQEIVLKNSDQAAIIYGNHDQLMQLFINLAQNACEAAPAGETISWELRVKSAAKAVEVSITNGGAPLTQGQMEHVFEPFFTTKTHGTGLGLGIVKRLVEGHGGEIRMESTAETSTIVTVVFPLAHD